MIQIINKIDDNTFLIHFEDTEIFQVWDKWELIELLVSHQGNYYRLGYDDDFIIKNVKEGKENNSFQSKVSK